MAVPEIPLIRIFVFVAQRLLTAELDREYRRLTALPPRGDLVLFEGMFNLLKTSMVFTRTGEDVAVIGFHVAPLRAGLIADTPADDDEMDTVKDKCEALWLELQGFYPPELEYDRIVFHDAGPKITGTDGKTIHDVGQPKGTWNPQLRADTIASFRAGDSETVKLLPDQVAMSVTQRTVARKQWGRVYLPAGDANMIADTQAHAEGARQYDSATVTAVRNAFGTFADHLLAADIPLVVWSHVHQHALSVDQIQVDSIPDVIRRRRDDRPFIRLTHTVS